MSVHYLSYFVLTFSSRDLYNILWSIIITFDELKKSFHDTNFSCGWTHGNECVGSYGPPGEYQDGSVRKDRGLSSVSN